VQIVNVEKLIYFLYINYASAQEKYANAFCYNYFG